MHDLGVHLLRRAEDVRVVLREAARTHEPVHDAGELVAIDRAELEHAPRQIAVGAHIVVVDHDVARAVHRLDAVVA